MAKGKKPGGGGGGGGSNTVPQVTGLTATVRFGTEIYLQWNPVAGATTYWIYRNGYVGWVIPGTSFVDLYVSPGVEYTYAIAAVVNSTLGPKSVSVTIKF